MEHSLFHCLMTVIPVAHKSRNVSPSAFPFLLRQVSLHTSLYHSFLMNLVRVSVSDIGPINFVCNPACAQCLLDQEWVNDHLPGFTAGYRIISGVSPYGDFASMQWFGVTDLPAGVDASFGSLLVDEYNHHVLHHQQHNCVRISLLSFAPKLMRFSVYPRFYVIKSIISLLPPLPQ